MLNGNEVREMTWFELLLSTAIGLVLAGVKAALLTAVVILTARYMGAL